MTCAAVDSLKDGVSLATHGSARKGARLNFLSWSFVQHFTRSIHGWRSLTTTIALTGVAANMGKLVGVLTETVVIQEAKLSPTRWHIAQSCFPAQLKTPSWSFGVHLRVHSSQQVGALVLKNVKRKVTSVVLGLGLGQGKWIDAISTTKELERQPCLQNVLNPTQIV